MWTRSPSSGPLQGPQPAFPVMPGMPERRTHDYVRHGTTTLFAALNVAEWTVITSTHRRHRAIECKEFLTKIEATVPQDLEIHLICDNYGTHKHPIIKAWLAEHDRGHAASHPDLLLLAQPGRAVLRLRHRRPTPQVGAGFSSSATHSTWWVIGNTSMGLSVSAIPCGWLHPTGETAL